MIDNWHLTMQGSHMILRCSGWGNTIGICLPTKVFFCEIRLEEKIIQLYSVLKIADGKYKVE